jgi:hypothetical protein
MSVVYLENRMTKAEAPSLRTLDRPRDADERRKKAEDGGGVFL